MSDTESDDEFLSADEGDFEDGDKRVAIDEEEVDEIMDMLMNNQNIKNHPIERQNNEGIQSTNKIVESTTSLQASVQEPKCDKNQILPPSPTDPVETNIDELSTTNGNKNEEISENKCENKVIDEDVKHDKEDTPEENLENMIKESIKEQQENVLKEKKGLDDDSNKKDVTMNKFEESENKENICEDKTNHTESIENVEAVIPETNKEDDNKNNIIENQNRSKNTADSLVESNKNDDNKEKNKVDNSTFQDDAIQVENNIIDEVNKAIEYSKTIDEDNKTVEVNKTIDENKTNYKNDTLDDAIQSLDDLDLNDPSDDEDENTNLQESNNPVPIKEQSLEESILEQTENSSLPLLNSNKKQSKIHDQEIENKISDPIEELLTETKYNVEKNVDQEKQNGDIPNGKQMEADETENPNVKSTPPVSKKIEYIKNVENIKDGPQEDTLPEIGDHETEDQGDWGDWGNDDLPNVDCSDTSNIERLIFKSLSFFFFCIILFIQ